MPASRVEHAASAGVTAPVLTVRELLDACANGWPLEQYSPLLRHKYLLLDFDADIPALANARVDGIVQRLRLLPCPVIAVSPPPEPAWLRAVDVVVDGLAAAAPLIRNIEDYPLAAMTLVQLLRHCEGMSPEQALFAESVAYASLQNGADFKRAVHGSQRVGPQSGVDIEAECAEPVVLRRSGDELAITFNRPHARNAYSAAMRDSFYEALQLLRSDAGLRRAVVSGAGSCFCIGGDLREFGTAADPSTAHAIRSTRNVALALLQLRGRLEFQLHSACIGSGIELPAFAARVVAHGNAFMQLPEIRLGLLPGAGGTVSIARRIGRQRTAWLALSARRITAATALQWGLIDAIIQ